MLGTKLQEFVRTALTHDFLTLLQESVSINAQLILLKATPDACALKEPSLTTTISFAENAKMSTQNALSVKKTQS